MGRRTMFCTVCGELSAGCTYCSDACKMKAYRRRRKARKEAANLTLDMPTWLIQDGLVKSFGDRLAGDLGNFFHSYGKSAYTDMLLILDGVLGNRAYDGSGD